MLKNKMKEFIKICANELGFDDCKIVGVEPFDIWQKDSEHKKTGVDTSYLEHDPGKVLDGATAVIVLFKRYNPVGRGLQFSRYYIPSNEGYFATKELAKLIKAEGYKAIANPSLPARAAAIRSGGIIGDNELYYHPEFGSRVSIHIILTDACEPDIYEPASECAHCGCCAAACPTGALPGFDAKKCIRHLFNRNMPEQYRDKVDMLLGCEICQNACPMNKDIFIDATAEEQDALSFERLLEKDVKSAAKLIGKNYAKVSWLVPQAVLYIGANRLKECLPQIEKLTEDEDLRIREYAIWAKNRLNSDN